MSDCKVQQENEKLKQEIEDLKKQHKEDIETLREMLTRD